MYTNYLEIAQDSLVKQALLHGVNVAALPHLAGPVHAVNAEQEAVALAEALHVAAVKVVPCCDLSQAHSNQWVGRAASMFAAWCQLHQGAAPEDTPESEAWKWGKTPENVTHNDATKYGQENLLAFASFL